MGRLELKIIWEIRKKLYDFLWRSVNSTVYEIALGKALFTTDVEQICKSAKPEEKDLKSPTATFPSLFSPQLQDVSQLKLDE